MFKFFPKEFVKKISKAQISGLLKNLANLLFHIVLSNGAKKLDTCTLQTPFPCILLTSVLFVYLSTNYRGSPL